MPKFNGGDSRRLFARRALGEALSFVDELRGRPQRRLSAIGSLPPEKLETIKGALREDVQMAMTEEGLCVPATDAAGPNESVCVLEGTPENRAVFGLLNGAQTLGEVTDIIARDFGWERDQAWNHVVRVFVTLVERGVCVPTNVVD